MSPRLLLLWLLACGSPTEDVPVADPSWDTSVQGAGGTVLLSGVVDFGEGVGAGEVALALLQVGGAAAAPRVRFATTLPGPGTFTVSVPARLGPVRVVAWMDPGNDGPGPDDPLALAVQNPLRIGASDLVDVQVVRSPGGSPPG